jgi:predicted MFS family arabinose efflux permease
MTTSVSIAAFGNFLPVMIKGFGYSALDTNLLVIPVWVCSGFFIIATGIISDRIKKRGIMMLISFAIASIGWIILLASKSQWVEFVGTMFIGSGTLPQVVLCLAWMNSNMLSYTKRYFRSFLI